jgi:hypothetical protein
MIKNLSVILPCAGSGTRLGLDFPKELYEIYDGFKLIDFSLNHILAFLDKNPEINLKIIAVTTPSKKTILDYIKKKVKGKNVINVFFNEKYYEWAGSVYSAASHFEENNIVLLPDSSMRLSMANVYFDDKGKTLIEKMIDSLNNSMVSFAYKMCRDIERLSKLGSLYVYDSKIYLFQDKPDDNVRNYNAFWASYGFNKCCAKELYLFLKESILHNKPEFEKQVFYPSGGFEIADYHDLGTWESINSFLKNENKSDFFYNSSNS